MMFWIYGVLVCTDGGTTAAAASNQQSSQDVENARKKLEEEKEHLRQVSLSLGRCAMMIHLSSIQEFKSISGHCLTLKRLVALWFMKTDWSCGVQMEWVFG